MSAAMQPDFGTLITLFVDVSVKSYTPGKPVRMPTPNNPGDPEEPEEIEIAVFSEDGEDITRMVPDDVFDDLLVEAAEYMREANLYGY